MGLPTPQTFNLKFTMGPKLIHFGYCFVAPSATNAAAFWPKTVADILTTQVHLSATVFLGPRPPTRGWPWATLTRDPFGGIIYLAKNRNFWEPVMRPHPAPKSKRRSGKRAGLYALSYHVVRNRLPDQTMSVTQHPSMFSEPGHYRQWQIIIFAKGP